jgi:hypothetical protein
LARFSSKPAHHVLAESLGATEPAKLFVADTGAALKTADPHS